MSFLWCVPVSLRFNLRFLSGWRWWWLPSSLCCKLYGLQPTITPVVLLEERIKKTLSSPWIIRSFYRNILLELKVCFKSELEPSQSHNMRVKLAWMPLFERNSEQQLVFKFGIIDFFGGQNFRSILDVFDVWYLTRFSFYRLNKKRATLSVFLLWTMQRVYCGGGVRWK